MKFLVRNFDSLLPIDETLLMSETAEQGYRRHQIHINRRFLDTPSWTTRIESESETDRSCSFRPASRGRSKRTELTVYHGERSLPAATPPHLE